VYNVPRIGGQHAEYLVKALQAYKTDVRSHPSMKAIAASLSEQDIEDLAAYYAGSSGK
jgi:cytochrome c553